MEGYENQSGPGMNSTTDWHLVTTDGETHSKLKETGAQLVVLAPSVRRPPPVAVICTRSTFFNSGAIHSFLVSGCLDSILPSVIRDIRTLLRGNKVCVSILKCTHRERKQILLSLVALPYHVFLNAHTLQSSRQVGFESAFH